MIPKNIYVVRHFKSDINLNLHNNEISYNYDILSLNESLLKKTRTKLKNTILVNNSIIISSPSKRCVSTANLIADMLKINSFSQNLLLYKQNYGLFTKVDKNDWEKTFPIEYAGYKKCLQEEGLFFTRKPYGDSGYDVYVRLSNFIDRFFLDNKFENVIIVTHSSTIKILTMLLMKYDVNWYEKQRDFSFFKIRHFIYNKEEFTYKDFKIK